MRTHEQIIIDAGGYQGLADRLGERASRVRFWARRKSIPADRWRAIAHAKLATLEELAAAAEARASETHTLTNSDAPEKPNGVHCEHAAAANGDGAVA